MILIDINAALRGMITKLINSGWSKTNVGRILLGANGQAHMNHWMKSKDDGSPNDFGIKPLDRIAKLLDYETHVVFVKPGENPQAIEYIDNLNNEYIQQLEKACSDVLSNNIPAPKTGKSGKGQIDAVLDDLLS